MGLPSRLGCVCIFQRVLNSFYSHKKEKKKKVTVYEVSVCIHVAFTASGVSCVFFFSLAPARILGGQTATIHEQ